MGRKKEWTDVWQMRSYRHERWKSKKLKASKAKSLVTICLQHLLAYIHSTTANENPFWYHLRVSISCWVDSSPKKIIIIHSPLPLSKPAWLCFFRGEQRLYSWSLCSVSLKQNALHNTESIFFDFEYRLFGSSHFNETIRAANTFFIINCVLHGRKEV